MKKNNQTICIIILSCLVILLGIIVLLLCIANFYSHSNITYYYDSHDKRYTAVISENTSNYYIHIEPRYTEEDIKELIQTKQSLHKEKYFSKYSYGKIGGLIVDWEEHNNTLWIWSGDIGIIVIQEKNGSWCERGFEEIEEQIYLEDIPDKIRMKMNLNKE